ncbi:MAG: glycoside hydrolase family 15 protein [Candidatus Korobacteraceae bacterium]|jgi:phosphorylase kinase alpha/beta subunit
MADNLRLQQLIKPEYRLQDLDEIEQFLEQHHTLDLYPVANHLYAAVTGLPSDSTTGYQDVWLRDNVMVANSFRLRGEVERAKETMLALTSLLRTQSDRFEAVIANPRLKLIVQNRPHVRFNAVDGTSDPSWSHAQNDALGYTLWLRFVMANSGQLDLDERDYQLYRLFPPYFNAIRYWEDADSGAWEEDLKVNSSSIGVVAAGLRAMEAYLQGKGGATWKDRDDLLQMIRGLVGKGLAHLEQSLPCESPPQRCADGALLFLIYPVNVLSPEQEDLVLKIVKSDLVRDAGIIRYVGDSYFGQDYPEWFSEKELTADFSNRIGERNKRLKPGYEAQWCIFDPVISIIHGYRYLADPSQENELKQQTHFLNRALRQVTEAGKCPELYYCQHGRWVPNPHTPLAWTQANLAVALSLMRKSLTLG